MLMLLFHAGDNLYAIDTSQVVEVIPLIVLRKIYHVPDYVAGVFNYHGTIVPVIDLCYLIQGTACRSCFSTRIIMVNYTTKDSGHRCLGLMAQVTETLNRHDPEPNNTLTMNDLPYLGEMFMDEKGMIQQIHWQHLIAEVQHASVLAGGNIQSNGASSN